MTIEASIFDSLKGLVGNRVFPDVAPPTTAKPFIVYQQIGGSAVNFVDSTSPSKKNGRFQVAVWGNTRAEVSALARSIEDTLRGNAALQTSVVSAPVADYEQETGLRGSRQDFSFWFTN